MFPTKRRKTSSRDDAAALIQRTWMDYVCVNTECPICLDDAICDVVTTKVHLPSRRHARRRYHVRCLAEYAIRSDVEPVSKEPLPAALLTRLMPSESSFAQKLTAEIDVLVSDAFHNPDVYTWFSLLVVPVTCLAHLSLDRCIRKLSECVDTLSDHPSSVEFCFFCAWLKDSLASVT